MSNKTLSLPHPGKVFGALLLGGLTGLVVFSFVKPFIDRMYVSRFVKNTKNLYKHRAQASEFFTPEIRENLLSQPGLLPDHKEELSAAFERVTEALRNVANTFRILTPKSELIREHEFLNKDKPSPKDLDSLFQNGGLTLYRHSELAEVQKATSQYNQLVNSLRKKGLALDNKFTFECPPE